MAGEDRTDEKQSNNMKRSKLIRFNYYCHAVVMGILAGSGCVMMFDTNAMAVGVFVAAWGILAAKLISDFSK